MHGRIFENEGVLVGDYRKGESLASDPTEDITLWVLPLPVAILLCRIIIFGKPIEARLAERLASPEAAVVHKYMLGAVDGKPLKSTKLGLLTNSLLATHGCPTVMHMRHVREHFSTELLLEDDTLQKQEAKAGREEKLHGIAAIASNHAPETAKRLYAGVFEKHR